jgi:hypothetical protein
MKRGLARRNVLLEKRKLTKEEERELKVLMKEFPFESSKGKLEAARIYRKGIDKLFKKFVGKK